MLPMCAIKRIIYNRSIIRTRSSTKLDIAELADFKHVMVVAPHPDDESLGCGGTIAALAETGHIVTVIFVCNGNGSHPNSLEFPPDAVSELRKCEALAAVAALGIAAENVIFLDRADGTAPLPTDPDFDEVVQLFRQAASTRKIDLGLIPWRRDSSRDHQAVWHIAWTSFAKEGNKTRILEYPVWVYENNSDAPAEDEMKILRLPIERWISRKRSAIRCHRSQLGQTITDDPSCFKLERPFLANFAYDQEFLFEEPSSFSG